jgi:hypothetical protein
MGEHRVVLVRPPVVWHAPGSKRLDLLALTVHVQPQLPAEPGEGGPGCQVIRGVAHASATVDVESFVCLLLLASRGCVAMKNRSYMSPRTWM